MIAKFKVPSSMSCLFLYTAAMTLDAYVDKLEPGADEDLIWLCTQGDCPPDQVVTLERFIMYLASNMSVVSHRSVIAEGEKKSVLILDIYARDFNLDSDRIANLIQDVANASSGFVRTR